MHFLDILIFFIYMASMLGIGFFFMKKNENADDTFIIISYFSSAEEYELLEEGE